MTDSSSFPAVPLKVQKATTLPFQEVTILDETLVVRGKKTLTEEDMVLEVNLAPGSYMISGLSPSGTSTKIPVTLLEGAPQTVTANTRQDSPHEWLSDINARQQLPVSLANVTQSAVETLGSRAVQEIRDVSPLGSLSLPTSVVNFAANGLVDSAITTLNKRLELESRPKSSTRRPQDISLRTYFWSTESGRWMRSGLIEQAKGEYALDYTRLNFPPRDEAGNGLANKLHLVGAFLSGQPAKFIALPLFAAGARLVLSHGSAVGGGARDTRPDRDGPVRSGSAATALHDQTAEWNAQEISWRLSAADGDIDALLQALNGRGFQNRDAVSATAIRFADKALNEKRRDPEAAVVAGMFLLQYRRLDERAQWVENLAKWFPWSPDALALGAWGNILFETGSATEVLEKLSRIYKAGPPQFLPTRRLLRDLISIRMSAEDNAGLSGKTKNLLQKLWVRIGREMQREIPGGPFYSFERAYKLGPRS
ncbi:hypothetical protein IWQ54_002481 [Labrenzia sp. EL_195]|nr:hypothetical protein [Labrenzia sp. EL_195]